MFLSNRKKEENGASSCRENLRLFFYLQTAIDDEATDSALCAWADLLCLEKWGNHSSRLLEQMLLFTPSR
ncbi:hypothetical protein [Enterococcus casseliflavus]|uniref:hypothetical protein n=1 Tax=Enterococcus casseliflavus TaxID=37734 RepID=UPI002DBD97F7|nr:hypothetical protein [Enterococcus casseliflavus]MEB6146187.1 hypothetical protein [Enterococcus casseliflavus]